MDIYNAKLHIQTEYGLLIYNLNTGEEQVIKA